MNKKQIILFFTALICIRATTWAQFHEKSDSLVSELQEIVVKAKSPATKLVGNTLVSTIAGTPLQNLGTCLDVLRQLPLMSVNDGDVTVLGKGTPEIFIDGRAMRDADELRQLQSANIKRVELLLAPGAMYSAATQAVLRITTKRNFFQGLSLTDRAEVIARRKLSVNDLLDINYRNGNWDFFATGTVAHNNSMIKGSTINTLSYNGVNTVVGSSQNNEYPTNTGTVKAGFNCASANQSFGAYYRYNPERGDFTNNGTEWLNDNEPFMRNIKRSINAKSHLASIYYDNTLADKYHLHFDGNYRRSFSNGDTNTSYPTLEIPAVCSEDSRNSELWAGKLTLDFPLWNGSLIIGTEDSFTRTKLDYRMLNESVGAYIPSSFTDVRQTSLAGFASWERTFGKLSLTAGLRYEYVDYIFKKDVQKDSDLSRAHNTITPDVSLSWMFNEDSQVSLSYRMATLKPPYSQLTGSLNYVGMHEIEGGNPALRDEKMHDVQLFGMWNGFMIQADYTRSIDSYAFVKKIYPAENLQLIMQPVNINVSAVDAYLIWSKGIGVWTPNITLGMHKQWLILDTNKYNRPIFSYYFDNLFTFPHDFQITLNMYGQSKGDMHTNRFGATICSVNASIGKSFFNKSLQVKLSATDIFNTANNDWTMLTYGVFVDKRQSYDRRGVSLSITYRFNPYRSKYKGKNASEAEMNRL